MDASNAAHDHESRPFWVAIRRSDLDGVRYVVLNTHSVTMEGKILDPEKPKEWMPMPTAKIHAFTSIQNCVDIIMTGCNALTASTFMLLGVHHREPTFHRSYAGMLVLNASSPSRQF